MKIHDYCSSVLFRPDFTVGKPKLDSNFLQINILRIIVVLCL